MGRAKGKGTHLCQHSSIRTRNNKNTNNEEKHEAYRESGLIGKFRLTIVFPLLIFASSLQQKLEAALIPRKSFNVSVVGMLVLMYLTHDGA